MPDAAESFRKHRGEALSHCGGREGFLLVGTYSVAERIQVYACYSVIISSSTFLHSQKGSRLVDQSCDHLITGDREVRRELEVGKYSKQRS